MKSQQEVLDRVRFLLSRELDRRVQIASQRLPHRCVHNYRHPVDVRKQVDGEDNPNYNRIALPVVQASLGLCTLGMDNPSEWNGNICEDPIDAQRCPYFTSTQSKLDIWDEFRTQVNDPVWLEASLPEVYGLLWTLEAPGAGIPWWKRLWFKLLRINVEPVRQGFDLTLLDSGPQ